MKALRYGLVIMAVGLMTFGLIGTAGAFHSGGVAECVGCHSMHDAAGGALLVGADNSSTCLSCHNSTSGGSYHISTDESVAGPPLNMTPGGDFAWLKRDYTWNPGWAPQNEDGERHGHNIVASDFNYVADGTNTTTPGGGPSGLPATLSCTSCHDQHGKLRRLSDGTISTSGAPIIDSGSYGTIPSAGQAVGVYRLLRGAGSVPDLVGGVTFTTAAPSAVAPSTYNRSEFTTDTRVAYGAGMSQFCATCHPDMHGLSSTKLIHKADDTLGSAIAANYNSYIGSGNLGGTSGTSYDSLVPFQTDNATSIATLAALADNTGTVTTGPGSNDKINCLSCHRAHASGWEHMTRWDNDIEMIIVDGQWPGTDATGSVATLAKWAKGRTQAERARAYNDTNATNYATYQRVLCNKCHAKD